MGAEDTVTRLGTDCLPGKTGLPYGPSGGALGDRLFVNLASYFGGMGETENFEESTKGFRIPSENKVAQNFDLM